jgi:hypothetical protein
VGKLVALQKVTKERSRWKTKLALGHGLWVRDWRAKARADWKSCDTVPTCREKPALRYLKFWDLADAHVAQSVERVLGKDEVISSILIMGSISGRGLREEDVVSDQ